MRILATAGSGAATGGGSTMLIMIVAMIAVMYAFMIRPQRKEQQKMQEMLGAMEVGDAIMTTGGFYGILIDIGEEDVIVEFGNNKNCRIPMKKEAIARVEKPGEASAPAEPETRKSRKERKAQEKAAREAEEAKGAVKEIQETVAEAKDEVEA